MSELRFPPLRSGLESPHPSDRRWAYPLWTVAFASLLLVGQARQFARVLDGDAALQVGRRLLIERAQRGWSDLDESRADDLERRHGRVLAVSDGRMILIYQRDWRHYDAIYRLDCERGAVEVDFCVVRKDERWYVHKSIVHDDLP